MPDTIDFNVYQPFERNGVIAIAIAGTTSLLAITILVTTVLPRTKSRQNSHILGYLLSLLLANTVQSVGTVMNFRWVAERGVEMGSFCRSQGGIKQAGNVGTALWSFMISLHLFNLIFLRYPSTRIGFCLTLVLGWAAVIIVVVIGPTAIQTKSHGPYFGISGPWCWITDEYPIPQFFLEYFFEFLSAGLSFILYSFILLRVRGNLISNNGKWSLRFVPSGDSWQLSFARDLVDSSMLRVAQIMVWYPVAYSILLVPIALARLTEFSGHKVPFWATVLTDMIFNLTGFVNVVLWYKTHELFPDTATLPEFSMRRKTLIMPFSKSGVTPFTLMGSPTAESRTAELLTRPMAAARSSASQSSRSTMISIYSVDSRTPLR